MHSDKKIIPDFTPAWDAAYKKAKAKASQFFAPYYGGKVSR
jgi:hypothetical protein